MKKKLTILLIIISVFFGLATPKVSQAACIPGIPIPGFTGSAFNLPDCAGILLSHIAIPIAAKGVELSARLFDFSIKTNLEIGKFVTSADPTVLSPVENIWRIIRDLSGMFFIFILIWASIQIILNGASAKNAITGVVIAALMVNFSLFLTKVVVDFSNTLSLTIYSAIVPNGTNSVSEVITSVASLQSLFISSQNMAKAVNFNITTIIVLFLALCFMVVIAIAFLAGAVMFLWRFIMLIALMAFSPVWAISKAIPQFSQTGDKFIKNLVDQSMFAPIFLFFIYIGLKIMTDVGFIKNLGVGSSNLATPLGEANGFIGPIFQYGLAIFVIFQGLVIAKSMGAKGADMGINWMIGLRKWGQGAVTGMGRGVVRNTAGLISNKLSDTNFVKESAKNTSLGMLALKGLKAGGKSYEDNIKKQAEARASNAALLGFNKKVVKKYEDYIEENLGYIDNEKMTLEDPSLTIDQRKAKEARIKQLEISNREWKKKISDEKLRRQGVYAGIEDPTLNLETGKRDKKMNLLQRANRFGFISPVNEETASKIGLKNIEEEIKDREETIKKLNEKRDQAKKDMSKRKDEISKKVNEEAKRVGAGFDKKAALEQALKDDGFYNDKKGDLYKILNNTPENNNKGLVAHEAELRALKAAEKKLKA